MTAVAEGVMSRLGFSHFTAAALAALVFGCRAAPGIASNEIIVPATDYAFQIRRELPAGAAVFRLVNQGRVPHELALGRLKPGVTADSLLAFAAAGGDPGDLADGVVGILIAGPGETSIGSLAADLTPGRTYMMICQFQDADSLPPHVVLGMQAAFTVK
jgi:hypothetical protein